MSMGSFPDGHMKFVVWETFRLSCQCSSRAEVRQQRTSDVCRPRASAGRRAALSLSPPRLRVASGVWPTSKRRPRRRSPHETSLPATVSEPLRFLLRRRRPRWKKQKTKQKASCDKPGGRGRGKAGGRTSAIVEKTNPQILEGCVCHSAVRGRLPTAVYLGMFRNQN